MNQLLDDIHNVLQRVQIATGVSSSNSLISGNNISLSQTCVVHDWARTTVGMQCITCGKLGIRRIESTHKHVCFQKSDKLNSCHFDK